METGNRQAGGAVQGLLRYGQVFSFRTTCLSFAAARLRNGGSDAGAKLQTRELPDTRSEVGECLKFSRYRFAPCLKDLPCPSTSARAHCLNWGKSTRIGSCTRCWKTAERCRPSLPLKTGKWLGSPRS